MTQNTCLSSIPSAHVPSRTGGTTQWPGLPIYRHHLGQERERSIMIHLLQLVRPHQAMLWPDDVLEAAGCLQLLGICQGVILSSGGNPSLRPARSHHHSTADITLTFTSPRTGNHLPEATSAWEIVV
jgi:hypothetical protein